MTRPADAIVDDAVLASLRSLQEPGGPDIVAETIAIYLADARSRLDLLRGAVGAADAPQVHQLSHAIRGASLVIGTQRVAAACETLETLARAGRLADAPLWLGKVTEELDLAEAELRRLVA